MNSYAVNKKKILVPKSNLPVEINFLIQSIQMGKLSPIEKRRIDQTIIKLDQLMEKLSKEEIFFVIKTEAYKVILKNKPDILINRNSYNKDILDKFDPYIKKSKLSPFSKWVLYSIKSDLEEIFESPLFATWKIRKKYKNNLDRKLLRLEKKLELLVPWYEYISSTEAREFDENLKPVMMNLLERINLYFFQLVKYSSTQAMDLSPIRPKFTYFEEKEFDLDTKSEVISVTLEKVVDSVLKDNTPPALPTPVNDWLPREDGSTPETARAYPTPDPNYKVPDNLPKPVDDWFNEL
ncbi:MAG: hypothetical protein KC493_02205 [Bacteriovoracaceae bacterium]|nr:hypothetical protein [Bacteriovoracaceae bacterium]